MRVNAWVVEIALPNCNTPTDERMGPIRFEIAMQYCCITYGGQDNNKPVVCKQSVCLAALHQTATTYSRDSYEA
jgi:hypothetical protein